MKTSKRDSRQSQKSKYVGLIDKEDDEVLAQETTFDLEELNYSLWEISTT